MYIYICICIYTYTKTHYVGGARVHRWPSYNLDSLFDISSLLDALLLFIITTTIFDRVRSSGTRERTILVHTLLTTSNTIFENPEHR